MTHGWCYTVHILDHSLVRAALFAVGSVSLLTLASSSSASVDVTDVRRQPCESTANYQSELPAGIGHEGPSGSANGHNARPLGPVGQLRAAVAVVREVS